MTDRVAFLSDLIGRPYRIGATGPDCFDCYGLARHVQATLYDVPMPELPFVAATTRQQAEAMLNHAERQNWREIPEHEARDGDLVLMGNVARRDFHLGTYVVPGTAGVVLHIDKANGVVADDLPSLRAIGFHYLKVFRRLDCSRRGVI
ncbi:NlpC/P60 family protein [Methylorubrum populi]|uniref:Cell wall-associated hydrolases (Invasion-associated proteins) n=1 Tax=Methylorubrum populi TaxID=223967 RepID=A0A833J2U9_9HYPH|nr:NlpC/P60 family protein [Methylorubrum populi]KAB7783490.1 Cell wall-associated hydrolases (invasion-associated proteins) [Methylorubrum populi]